MGSMVGNILALIMFLGPSMGMAVTDQVQGFSLRSGGVLNVTGVNIPDLAANPYESLVTIDEKESSSEEICREERNSPMIGEGGLNKYCIDVLSRIGGIYLNATDSQTIKDLSVEIAQILEEGQRLARNPKVTEFLQRISESMVVDAINDLSTKMQNDDFFQFTGLSKAQLVPQLRARAEQLEKSEAVLEGLAEGFKSASLKKLLETRRLMRCANNPGGILRRNSKGLWDLDYAASQKAFLEANPEKPHICRPFSVNQLLQERDQGYRFSLNPKLANLNKALEEIARTEKTKKETPVVQKTNSTSCDFAQVKELKAHLCNLYRESKVNGGGELIGRFHASIKPIKTKEDHCVHLTIVARFSNGQLVAPKVPEGTSKKIREEMKNRQEVGQRLMEQENKSQYGVNIQFSELNKYLETIKKECGGNQEPSAEKAPSSSEGQQK